MERQQINPWSWQERFGYSQAWRVEGAGALVFTAGQGPVSASGQLVGDDDFDEQVRQTFRCLETVLGAAGASLDSIVKLGVFLTDIGRLRDYGRVRGEFLTGPPPASTAVEVGALALPGMMIEVEAVAAVAARAA
jgi:enamine deaminase RidA (YjgF/YER057c/UK114 family)